MRFNMKVQYMPQQFSYEIQVKNAVYLIPKLKLISSDLPQTLDKAALFLTAQSKTKVTSDEIQEALYQVTEKVV